MASAFDKLPELLMKKIMLYLSSNELASMTKLSKKLRLVALTELRRHHERRHDLTWNYGKLSFERNGVTLSSQKAMVPVGKTKRRKCNQLTNIQYTKEEIVQFFEIYNPRFEMFHIRTRYLDEKIVNLIRNFNCQNCCYEPQHTLLLDLDRCDLSSYQLKEFLEYMNPVALHFYGLFDRTIITGSIFPQRTQNIFIAEHPTLKNNYSNLNNDFFLSLLESWEKTASEGLFLSLPDYEVHHSPPVLEGNHRRIDIDKCHLSADQLREIQRICCSRLFLFQIINFYNANGSEMDLAIRHPRDIPLHSFNQQLSDKGYLVYAMHTFRTHADGITFLIIANKNIVHLIDDHETVMCFNLNVYKRHQEKRAVLPMTILNDYHRK